VILKTKFQKLNLKILEKLDEKPCDILYGMVQLGHP